MKNFPPLIAAPKRLRSALHAVRGYACGLTIRIGLLAALSGALAAQAAASNVGLEVRLSEKQVMRLIADAEPGAVDKAGWAHDLRGALQAHRLPRMKENVCAMIAVVDQESGFVANPQVPHIGKIAYQAMLRKLNKPPYNFGKAFFLEHI
jgi:hypothetical protein